MLVYGLRILVALITFGAGVAASTLLSFKRAVTFKEPAKSCRAVLVARPAQEPTAPTLVQATVGLGNLEGADIEGGILNGKASSLPAADYPAAASAAKVRGTVYVRVLVDEGGRVASARAVGGHALLQQAAVDAARQAQFAPTRLSGRPVKVAGIITYNFAPR